MGKASARVHGVWPEACDLLGPLFRIASIIGSLLFIAHPLSATAGNLDSSYDMNVLVIKYLHLNRSNSVIDTNIEDYPWAYKHDYQKTNEFVDNQVEAMRLAAEESTRYQLYAYPPCPSDVILCPPGTYPEYQRPQPSLRYHVIDTREHSSYGDTLPFRPNGHVDYPRIMRDPGLNICDYVDYRGVREVWILKPPHQTRFNHWESFMSGPIVNTGNGGPEDVPVCRTTYRVYTHTYDRWDLFTEVWGHQIERELEHVDPKLFRRFNSPCAGVYHSDCAPRDASQVIGAGDSENGYFYGEYFKNTGEETWPPMGMRVPNLVRYDLEINFDWGQGSPAPLYLSPDHFSVRWTARLRPPARGDNDYTFYASTDDGVRLYVDGKKVIEHIVRESKSSVTLDGSKMFEIKMEYYEVGQGAMAQLRWSGPGIPWEPKMGGCGDMHTAPNGRWAYDRLNEDANYSDCINWEPDVMNRAADDPAPHLVSCANWSCNSTEGIESPTMQDILDNGIRQYSIWHWQNMPGRKNLKYYQGRKLRNWWDIHGNFDAVMRCNKSLVDVAWCQ